MRNEALDATLAAAGGKATYAGAGLTGLGWFISSEFFGLAGLAIGVIGLLINWFYKAKADKRVDQEHALRMDHLSRGRRTHVDLGELGAEE